MVRLYPTGVGAAAGVLTYEVDTDRELVALMDDYRRRGFVFAMHMLGNADDAADAVQDGLCAWWSQRGRVGQSPDSIAWFFRVVRNRCVDQLRKRSHRRHEVLSPEGPPDRRDPASAAGDERDEFLARLQNELDRMDEPLREILLLRDFHDLTYADIAEVLSIRVGTVMSRLHRARSKLRERMKGNLCADE